MRKNIKKNIKDFLSGISKKNIFSLYICLLFIPLFVFNTGCGGSRRYYQKKTISKSKDYHTVKKGETLYAIARKYKISPKSLIKYNRLKNPQKIEIGQRIYLPTKKKASSAYKSRKKKPSKKGRISTLKFKWPTKGTLTSKFGFRYGIPHKGIDIGTKHGNKVYAAYDGKVALVESRPRGLGNVIILKHKNDYLTVYGHNSKILVKEDQNVRKGQVISLIGSSGWSTGPHLHFEIRYKGEALNPLKHLP